MHVQRLFRLKNTSPTLSLVRHLWVGFSGHPPQSSWDMESNSCNYVTVLIYKKYTCSQVSLGIPVQIIVWVECISIMSNRNTYTIRVTSEENTCVRISSESLSIYYSVSMFSNVPACILKWPVLQTWVNFNPRIHKVFLNLFLRLPVVLSSSPLKILEWFCRGILSNGICVIRNALICFIIEGLFCLYNGRKTDRIWNYIFQRGQSSMVVIGPGRLCLVKIYIHKKKLFDLKWYCTKLASQKIVTFHRVIL